MQSINIEKRTIMNSYKNSAFTLVEIIITIAVLGAAVGLGTASYVSFNERQIVEQAALTLKNNFRSIQQRALSGQKDVEICRDAAGDPMNLAGWCFSPQENAATMQNDRYIVYGTCERDDGSMQPFPDPDHPDLNLRAEPDNISLPNHVRITSSVNNPLDPNIGGRIRFEAGSSRVAITAPDPADPTNFISFNEIAYCLISDLPSVSVPGSDNTYEIRVRATGEIVDLGFNGTTACPDPSMPLL